ncbi:MAG TPA: HEAT repeat domain-containing protein [Opitutaceae bacterium]|nr:HEAT repeat domain-containing protein [Opitutaceae bacterium]
MKPLTPMIKKALFQVLFCLAVAGLDLPRLSAQSVPAERPRNRPPSMLTGRAQWEKGADMLKAMNVPPAPPLSPEEALKTFRVAPGYRLELVAAEPMVQNPVFFEFDPEGRIWVAEFQGYMRDVNGTGEGDPICRIVVLEDTDFDGRADKSTVFLDRLVMPRSFAFVKGGLLLQEPPKLWFCEDTDGDLRCDRRTEVGTLGVAGNPQHTANGLRYGIDNWLHTADARTRHRWVDGQLQTQDVPKSGQFGVSFDETGRFLTCHESSALHADLIPSRYLLSNPNLAALAAKASRGAYGVDTNIARDAQQVYPIRVTPGITLGAMELRDDGRLRTYTISSGSCYYDGDQFGEEAYGNVFVPEAGGNLIGRLKVTWGLRPQASRFYPAEREFLASTDERFRPINARVGPDGALYLADLYRGIIEHVIFMVPWISDQIRDRKLDVGQDQGRIYRLVREDRPLNRRPPQLSKADSSVLVSHLSHPTGWWRTTAQRLLVERRDPAAIPLLRQLALKGERPLGRLHALWTLDGMDHLDTETKWSAMQDSDERVRAAAVRLCERGLTPEQQSLFLKTLEALIKDPSETVRLQATLTASALGRPESLPIVLRLALSSKDPILAIAAVTGLKDLEVEFLRLTLAETKASGSQNEAERFLLGLITRCIMESDEGARVYAMLASLVPPGREEPWQILAVLDAINEHAFKTKRRTQPIVLPAAPEALLALARSDQSRVREKASGLVDLFSWPGLRVTSEASSSVAPLSALEEERIQAGRELFGMYCAPCHQLNGLGAPNLAPPLADSEWVTGSPERVIRVVLHGLYGPIEVNGTTWNLAMPGLGAAGVLDDEKLASVVSYIRRAWGHAASPVEPTLVSTVRKASSARTLPWTAEELAAMESPLPVQPSMVGVGIAPDCHGMILLPASRATVYAQKLGYRPSLDVLAPWTVIDDVAEWRVEVPSAGTYRVWVNLAADDTSAGDYFVVETEGSRTRGMVISTGDYTQFREVASGTLTLRAGSNRILLRPDSPLKSELADIRGVRLEPQGKP